MVIYTSICANYLPKAMALAESVKRHCNCYFVLCLVERVAPEVALNFPHFDEVVLAKDADWENFDAFMFRHSIVEASTAVKPRFMLHLLNKFPSENNFIYLDPDVLVYGPFLELEEVLNSQPIVLCPHLLRPGNIDMEISSLAHGSYNLGFLAVTRSETALAFVNWWAERLFLFCYDDKSRGIFTDQKWIDLAPIFFDAFIFKHHGYDFATWSLLGSDLRESGDGYSINGDPLRFIHFSGLDSGIIERAMDWWLTPNNRAVFEKLYRDYVEVLESKGQGTLGKLEWSYANYTDGRKISPEARICYREPALWKEIPDPFSAGEETILKHCGEPTLSEGKQESIGPTLRMPANPSIIDRFMWSSLDVGIGPTFAKALRKLAGR